MAVGVPRHEALTRQFRTVHFCLCSAPAVIATPSSPKRTAEVFRRPQRRIARGRTCCDGLPRLGVLAGQDHGISTPSGDGIVARARVSGPVGSDSGDLLIGRDLAVQFGNHRGIAHVAAGDLDRSDLRRLFVGPEVDLPPDPAFWSAVLAPSSGKQSPPDGSPGAPHP